MSDSRSVLLNHIPDAYYKRDTGALFHTKGVALFTATLVRSAIVAGIAWRYLGAPAAQV